MTDSPWAPVPERIPDCPPAPPHHEGSPDTMPVPDWVRDAPQILPPTADQTGEGGLFDVNDAP